MKNWSNKMCCFFFCGKTTQEMEDFVFIEKAEIKYRLYMNKLAYGICLKSNLHSVVSENFHSR